MLVNVNIPTTVAELDKKSIKDGFRGFLGGVDSGTDPSAIDKTKLSWGENIVLRGGFPETRPGFQRITLRFDDEEIESWFKENLFQGYGIYKPLSGTAPFFVFSVGGRIFKSTVTKQTFLISEITSYSQTNTAANFISPPIGSNVTVTVDSTDGIIIGQPIFISDGKYIVVAKNLNTITITNLAATSGILVATGTQVKFIDTNNPNRSQAWFKQIGKWLVIQDGESSPILFDGVIARRSNFNTQEIQVGTVMEVFRNRLWIANGREYFAGDIDGGPSEPIKMTENIYLTGGGKFKVPADQGHITGMTVIASLDSALGEGPLLVGTTEGFFSVNAPAERDLWTDIQDPLQVPSVMNNGPMGNYSISNVNGDAFFRARDGIRSVQLARRDFGSWTNTSLSAELARAMQNDSEMLLKFASSIAFDNRLLMTVESVPIKSGKGAYFSAIASLDFDPVSRMLQIGNPIYDGIWRGLNVLMLMKGRFGGEERAFAMAYNSSNENEIWEITKDANFDGLEGRIKCAMEPHSLLFNGPMEMRKLDQFNLWIDHLVGQADFTLKYRPDQYPCWFTWGTKSQCAKFKSCGIDDVCNDPTTYKPGYKTRMRWAQPSEQDEEFDGKPASLFYELNLRLEWQGHARIKMGVAKARIIDEEPHSGDQ